MAKPSYHNFRDSSGRFRPKRGQVTRGGHRYVSRAEKIERGIPTNIYDAARSLREKRVAAGEEPQKLREILRDPTFRQQWEVWKDRERRFQDRVDAAEYWGWWEYDDEDDMWRYVG